MPPPLEAFAADLLALLEAPAPCAARDREPGTAGPRAVPAAVPAGPAEISSNNNGLQKSGPLGPLGPQKTDVAGFADSAAPPATPTDPEPTTHCPACGSPSWWRAPSSPGWRCAYCEPRDRAEAFESLTLASGQWAPGTRPPADPGDDPPEPHAPRPPRPDDGRVQDAFGAWRTPAEHAAVAAFYAHHWTCAVCIRAGRGYGTRCADGERLHAAMRAAS